MALDDVLKPTTEEKQAAPENLSGAEDRREEEEISLPQCTTVHGDCQDPISIIDAICSDLSCTNGNKDVAIETSITMIVPFIMSNQVDIMDASFKLAPASGQPITTTYKKLQDAIASVAPQSEVSGEPEVTSVEETKCIDDLYNTAKKAEGDERIPAILEFAKALSELDPLTQSVWADRAKSDRVCTKGQLAQAMEQTSLTDHMPTEDELTNMWLELHPHTAYGLHKWLRWNGVYWGEIAEHDVYNEIKEVLVSCKDSGIRPTNNMCTSVMNMAKNAVFTEPDIWDKEQDMIVCQNGTLNIRTRELSQHLPEHHFTSALEFDYDSSATCTTFIRALLSSVPDSHDLLQEYAGYCLTRDVRYDKLIWMYGPPGSGKSTIAEGFLAFLGRRVGRLGITDVERSRFALSSIVGKYLLVATEQPSIYMENSSLLNAIVSGEPITVERKFEHCFEVRPFAKILWAMNSLPRVKEAESGLFRRVLVVEFPPRPECERDESIRVQIASEGAGILNWALDGLDRLESNCSFSIPETVRFATDDFKQNNDVPASFLEDCGYTDKSWTHRSSVLYETYKTWCLENGHKPQSSTSIAKEWKRLGLTRNRTSDGVTWSNEVAEATSVEVTAVSAQDNMLEF